MTTKHTPGPWSYQATAGNHDFAVYPESTGRDIALVRDFNEPNARLIASAPELLEALELALEVLSDVGADITGMDQGESVGSLIAKVIAKATGL